MHPSRLPLGLGWRGVCTAPGAQEIAPGDDHLRDSCNLGYARKCPHLPAEHAWDAVRFAVARDCDTKIVLWYVCEFNHAPAEHGMLEYEAAKANWVRRHRDARIQKMAECYIQSYMEKTRAATVA